MEALAIQSPPPIPALRIVTPVAKRGILMTLRPWLITFMAAWTVGFLHNRYVDQDAAWTIGLYREKSARLAAMHDEHRIVLIGGSGTHFGFDAPTVGEALGRPIFNAGLDAGLGIGPICESIAHQVKAGDVLVLSPEYELLSGEGAISYLAPTFGWGTRQVGIGGGSLMERTQLALLGGVPGLRSITQSAKALLSKRYSNEAYAVTSLDAFGDPTLDPPSRAASTALIATLHPQIKRYLEGFVTHMRAKEVSVIIALPWRLVQRSDDSRAAVQELRKQLEGIAPVVCDDATLNLSNDPTLFTDTEYHLTTASRQRRSSELAFQIRPLLTAPQIEQNHER